MAHPSHCDSGYRLIKSLFDGDGHGPWEVFGWARNGSQGLDYGFFGWIPSGFYYPSIPFKEDKQ